MSKTVKMELKLSRPHPAKSIRLGSHKITQIFQEFELNENELKELQGKGPKHWIIAKETKETKVKEVKPAKPVKE